MSPEVQIALVGIGMALVTGIAVPVVRAWLEERALDRALKRRQVVRDAADDAIAYTTQVTRGGATNAKRRTLAVEHMREALDREPGVPTPPTDQLVEHVEAALGAARVSVPPSPVTISGGPNTVDVSGTPSAEAP